MKAGCSTRRTSSGPRRDGGVSLITKEKLEWMKNEAVKRKDFKEKARLDKMAQWIK